jgi:hypothetical protein
LSVALKLLTDNGRERKSDGLFRHMGLVDAGSLRAQDNQTGVRSGAGLELLFDKPSLTSYIVSYDRDNPQYRDLNIDARNVNIRSQQGGKVTLPAGSAQALIAQYLSGAAWSTSATGWIETGIQCSGTSTGGVQTRFEATIVWLHSVAGAGVYFHFYLDGGPLISALATVNAPAVNYAVTTSMILYTAGIAPGSHRFAVGINNGVGTFSLFTGAATALYVTEQRA